MAPASNERLARATSSALTPSLSKALIWAVRAASTASISVPGRGLPETPKVPESRPSALYQAPAEAATPCSTTSER